MSPMPEHRRVYLTSTWRLFARRWLATVICSLAISTLIFGLSGFVWQYNPSTAIHHELKRLDAPQPLRERTGKCILHLAG